MIPDAQSGPTLSDQPDPRRALAHAAGGGVFSAVQMEHVFDQMLSGAFDEAQIAGLLALIAARGVRVEELIGAARVMRRKVVAIPRPSVEGVVIDTCGTGGAPKTFNVSTAAAIVAASAKTTPRVLVAKHGNRSRSGRGSAEVLQALGVNVDASPEVQGRCLSEAGVCFCFAIHHHPAAKAAAGVRRSLGFPTMFNLLGPLTNPAGATRQLIGTWTPVNVDLMAGALAGLGADQALVVTGQDGMDEISTTMPTYAVHVERGVVRRGMIDTAQLGVRRATLAELEARDLAHAAEMVRGVIEGATGPAADIVIVNAAAALVVAGAAPEITAGMDQARAAIASGAARRTLETLAAVSRG